MSSATHESDNLSSSSSSSSSAHPCRCFSLAEIQSATKNFDDELVIGHGGFGKVYKGQISSEETDVVVAIKQSDPMSMQGAPEFRAEIEMLSMLRHCHLVSLIGYCDENKEMILVYKYMPHGTLYDHLHKLKSPLTWVQRLKIGIGAGRGLDYLHTGVGTQHGIIHRDVKSSNILLDENWAAMISDFGLSKIGPTNQSFSYVDASVKGTFGYLDPEYFYTRKLTRKTDVYAFGVVLFELLTGRLAVDGRRDEEQCSLVRWVQKCMKERKFDQMVDSNIKGTTSPKCLKGFAHIAHRCLRSVPNERPAMTEVVASLQSLLKLQEKFNNSAKSSNISGFTWKFHKYLVAATKDNSDQKGTSSSMQLENNMNQSSSSNRDRSDHGEQPHQLGELIATNCNDVNMVTYDELKDVTRNFEDSICQSVDSNGMVYEGWVNSTAYSLRGKNIGWHIAVKRLHRYTYFDPDVMKEFLHPNLVRCIGYSQNDGELFLVYEFMRNENFQYHLLNGNITQLPLAARVKIAVGIARGIVFLHKTQDEIRGDPNERGTVSESPLDRQKILLHEDWTPKLSGYDVTKLVYGHYTQAHKINTNLSYGDYYPGYHQESCPLQSNLLGFTVVFAEVLIGKQIYDENHVQMIDDMLLGYGKEPLSVVAKSCFQICNEVDSELQMLCILESFWDSLRKIY